MSVEKSIFSFQTMQIQKKTPTFANFAIERDSNDKNEMMVR